MFAPTRYLRWARCHYGQVEFDLATSGTPTVDAETAESLRAARGAAPCDPTAACEVLRDKIAAYNGVPAAEVVAALGTTHGIWLACAAALSPGDDVVIEDPGYEPLVRIAEGLGARVLRFQREARSGFAIDPERVAQAMTPRTKLVIVTNLHNPTGVRTSDDVLRATARIAGARGAHLLVDEVYAPFDALIGDDGAFHGSARKLEPNIVTVSSLTKCFGLGPERIGWVLGPAEFIERADDALVASVGMLPWSHACVGIAAFSALPALAVRSRALLAGKRERVAAWVATRGLSWSAPREGLFGLVTMPDEGDLTGTIEAAARERHVLVAPGAFFGAPSSFRLAWSLRAEQLDDALSRLGAALGL